MIYKRWQIAAIVVAVLIGILSALPNVVGPKVIAYLPFGRQIYLGLDLKGGTYLQMQVDIPAAEKDRAQTTLDTVRTALRTAHVNYTGLHVAGNSIAFTLADPNRLDDAKKALTLVTGTGPTADYSVTNTGGAVSLVPQEAALKNRVDDILQRSIEIVRRRIDETGVSEPTIARQGTDRIIVELPGVQDPDRIKRLLGTTAKLSFRLVDVNANPGQAVPPDDELLYGTDANGQQVPYVVQRRIAVAGDRLVSASAGFDPRTNEPVVNFGFDTRGAKEFGDITKANVGHPFAIVLDNKVLSAPNILEPILGGSGFIQGGDFTVESTNELAILLRGGALPAPLKVIEERTVGPNLGADAIRLGIDACAIGGVFVIVFMLYFYRLFGVFASVGMAINLALLIGVLSLLQASLTLPGIVGILLTVGMSVDANVLINERIREEARKGRTALSAIQTGFSRAMATIFDANTTTLLKMVILYGFGSGPVRGFAITISLGILTSLFTSVVLVRLFIALWYRRTRPKTLPITRADLFGPRLVRDDTSVGFMKGRHAGLITSAVLSISSLILANYPGLNYGIDFRGGIAIEAHMTKAVDFQALRGALGKLNLGPMELQQFGTPQDVAIRFERQPGDDSVQQTAASNVRATLQADFPGTTIESVDAVGATVSNELFRDGLTALGIAMFAMLCYIWFRFEWQFGVAATVTLLLDITKIVGLYALTQFQFNTTSIVAILTIMGYSINDKVVVYDRVRENLRLFRKMSLRELVDRSINETLSRTIATSGTVFLAIMPLALMGTGDIREFATVLLIGIVIGTSSSIFIAAPILLLLGEGRIRPGVTAAEPAVPAMATSSNSKLANSKLANSKLAKSKLAKSSAAKS